MLKVILVVLAAVIAGTEAVRLPNVGNLLGAQAAIKGRQIFGKPSLATTTPPPAPVAVAEKRIYRFPSFDDRDIMEHLLLEIISK